METFSELKRVAAKEKNYLSPFIDRLLEEKGITVDRTEKTRNPMSPYFACLDEMVSLPSGSEVRFADVLAALQYIHLQEAVERKTRE